MSRPLLLDLFCGAGGASMGYWEAGFDVVGVDIAPQPNYPFDFVQADAIDVLRWPGMFLRNYPVRAISASPPCQAYSVMKTLSTREWPRLVAATRDVLMLSGLPYVIENVVGAPMRDPVLLCGSMFGLNVKRHRLFELGGFDLPLRPYCQHGAWLRRFPANARKDKAQTSKVVHIYGTGAGRGKDLDLWRDAMVVPWMKTKAEVSEAIPPAYTRLIGEYLMDAVVAATRPKGATWKDALAQSSGSS